MQRNTVLIPRVTCGRIIEQEGARRVSAGAMDELSDYLIELGEDIAKDATEIARHAGRKTIKASDIKMAAKTK